MTAILIQQEYNNNTQYFILKHHHLLGHSYEETPVTNSLMRSLLSWSSRVSSQAVAVTPFTSNSRYGSVGSGIVIVIEDEMIERR